MHKVTGILLIAAAITGISGCYYDKADLVYPNVACDTAAVSYNSGIQTLMSTYCYECHAGAASGSFGINLDTYSNLKAVADNGKLLNRLTTNDPSIMMPKGGPRLSDCDINAFRKWVNNGAPN